MAEKPDAGRRQGREAREAEAQEPRRPRGRQGRGEGRQGRQGRRCPAKGGAKASRPRLHEGYAPRLKKHYDEVVRPKLIEEFGYKNAMQVPSDREDRAQHGRRRRR